MYERTQRSSNNTIKSWSKSSCKEQGISIFCVFSDYLKQGQSCADVAEGDCITLFKDLKQVKVLVLGKENVGKTTLVRRIIGDWGLGSWAKGIAFGKDTRIPTDGIDMKQWIPEGMESTVVYFWD